MNFGKDLFPATFGSGAAVVLRYGIQTGRYYYAEMSSFDVLYRRGLAPEGYKAAKDSVEGLMKYVPPTETGIALPQWELLLAKIKADWEKEDTYTGWEFVGAKTFTRFCSLAGKKWWKIFWL